MRSLPGTVRWLALSAAGVALAFFAVAAAPAQEAPLTHLPPGPCPSRSSEPLRPYVLYRCFYAASVRTTRAAQHQVGFETREDVLPETAALVVDAATATSEAFVRIADRPGGVAALARITLVSFAIGAEPSANLADGVLTITIAPSKGTAGLPSARQVEQAALQPH